MKANDNPGSGEEKTFRQYFKLSFFEAVNILISLVGFIAVIYTVRVNVDALKLNDQAIKSNIDLNMNNWSFEMDRVFIECPDLRKFFFDSVTPLLDSADAKSYSILNRHPGTQSEIVSKQVYDKITSVSDLVIDCFDGILSNKVYFQDKKNRDNWMYWIYNSFTRSPVLCKTFAQTPNEYGLEINELFKEWQQNIPADTLIINMKKRFYTE